MKSIITVTDSARDHLNLLLATSHNQVLLISLNNKGCSGHSYDYSWVDKSSLGKFDELMEFDNGTVAIKSSSVMQLLGSTLDYTSDIFESKLVWTNPQATGVCGCGKSVSF